MTAFAPDPTAPVSDAVQRVRQWPVQVGANGHSSGLLWLVCTPQGGHALVCPAHAAHWQQQAGYRVSWTQLIGHCEHAQLEQPELAA